MSDDFHKRKVIETTRQLTQDHDPPQVGVHTLSEYIFCKRAGLLTMEQSHDDLGGDFIPAPALGGIQLFEPDFIAAQLEQHTEKLKTYTATFLAIVGFAVGIGFTVGYDFRFGDVVAYGVLVGMISTGILWWRELQCCIRCWFRLRQARNAAKREPNWDLLSPQAVNWWELLQSGFDSRRMQHSLYHPEINLKGRPWRILHRGDRHLPVIRISVSEYDGTNLTAVRLYEKHRARLAAYAYLIETCEQAQADWVIVLYNDSDDGIAVPLGERDWKAFINGLLMARREISRLQENPRHRPRPPKGRQCAGCHFGRPRRVGRRPTVLLGTELPPFATSDSKGERLFHSTCGDRFQDVPPHHVAESLGILE